MIRRLAGGLAAASVVAVALLTPHPASAQSRLEMGAGVTWNGGFDAGGSDALLARNPATGSSPFVLFNTASRVNAAPGLTATIGVRLTSRLVLEASGEYSRPVLRSTISSDFEGATGTTAESRLTSLVLGGSALYDLRGRRLTPFVYGGGGWSRQLDEDNVMLVTGPELHGGAGVRYRLDRHFAVRGQGGVSVREKSLTFEQKWRALAVFSGSLLYRF